MWPFIYGKILQANNKGSVKKNLKLSLQNMLFQHFTTEIKTTQNFP